MEIDKLKDSFVNLKMFIYQNQLKWCVCLRVINVLRAEESESESESEAKARLLFLARKTRTKVKVSFETSKYLIFE